METTIHTTEMSHLLRDKLIKLGWDPEQVLWGRRVNGDPYGLTLEKEGVMRYHSGPFVTVCADGQSAIVRWD